MSKRHYIRMVSIILVMVFALTGCVDTQQQEAYASLCARYYELEEDYNELKSSYTKLQEEYERSQDLPDIEISLIDCLGNFFELTPHSSLVASQKDYTKCRYSRGHEGVGVACKVTITCNDGEEVEGIYWVDNNGEIKSVMDDVSNLDNTYILRILPKGYRINSFIIKYNGKNVYVSFYPG